MDVQCGCERLQHELENPSTVYDAQSPCAASGIGREGRRALSFYAKVFPRFLPHDNRLHPVCCRRLDGDMLKCRALVPIQTRSRSRKEFEREWYRRRERLVNQRRSASRTGEVDEKLMRSRTD